MLRIYLTSPTSAIATSTISIEVEREKTVPRAGYAQGGTRVRGDELKFGFVKVRYRGLDRTRTIFVRALW